MKAIIFEDEQLATERIQMLLRQLDQPVDVVASFDSVEDSISWLDRNNLPDLIISDIHLADGSAFDIFEHAKIPTPVIFVTAHDQYALDAFKVFSIDHLLKPVTANALAHAIDKLTLFHTCSQQRPIDYFQIARLFKPKTADYKMRFTGRIGQRLFFIDTREIAFFTADNKLVYLTAMDNAKYLVDHTMEELEQRLDPSMFFRINRGMIVHIAAIKQVKPYINNRLNIILRDGCKNTDTIVSRERVSQFRKWADG